MNIAINLPHHKKSHHFCQPNLWRILLQMQFHGERRITDYEQRIIEMPNILYYYYFHYYDLKSLIELSHKIMTLL